MHSNVAIKNVSWPHFSWPILYTGLTKNEDMTCPMHACSDHSLEHDLQLLYRANSVTFWCIYVCFQNATKINSKTILIYVKNCLLLTLYSYISLLILEFQSSPLSSLLSPSPLLFLHSSSNFELTFSTNHSYYKITPTALPSRIFYTLSVRYLVVVFSSHFLE